MINAQTAPTVSISEHLRGPWQAVLAEPDGHVHASVEEAIEELGEEEEVDIAVVRGTAVPTIRDGGLRRPGSYAEGDVAHEISCWLTDPDDESMGAAARWAQAQAMAAGLNAAARAR